VTARTVPMVQVTAGGYRWHLRPEYRDCLVGPQGLRLNEWLAEGKAQVVKHGPHRTVYHVTLPRLDFYLKHFRLMDMRAWLRELFRPPKARMEFDRALGVAGRAIATIRPLGVGVGIAGRAPANSFLIVESLPDVEPLNVFLEDTLSTLPRVRRTQLRQKLAEELGGMIARIHQAGVYHEDLHSGNILIGLDPGDRIRLYMIDLHAVHLGKRLNWWTARANLVILNRWFILRAERTDRFRFWKAYFQACGPEFAKKQHIGFMPPARADLARDLELGTWRSNLRFWRHRDRRCRETNRHYQRIRNGFAAGYAVRDLDRPTVEALLADPEKPFHLPGVRVLKESRSSKVVEWELPVNGILRRVIYKKFRITSWADPLVNVLRPSPTLRSWIFGQGLRERCLPTARPLAMFHRRRFGLSWEGYLLTEKIEAAVNLGQWVQELGHCPRMYRIAFLRRVIEKVARLLCDLHQRQLSHRDLKAPNILVSKIDWGKLASGLKTAGAGEISNDCDPGIWLIDLVGVRQYRRLPHGRPVQNLGRLNASVMQNAALSRTDRLRFLRTYLQWGLKSRRGWKKWWMEIEQATQAKLQKNIRNGRAIA